MIAAVLGLRLAAWGGLAFAAVAGAPLAAVPLGLAVALSVARERLRTAVSRIVEAPPETTSGRRWLLVVLPPLVDLCHLAIVVVAVTGRDLRWGRVDYRIGGRDSTTVVARRPYDGTAAAP